MLIQLLIFTHCFPVLKGRDNRYVCVQMWRSEIDTGYLPQSCFLFCYFKTRSLTECSPPRPPGIYLSLSQPPSPQEGGYRCIPAFNVGYGNQTPVKPTEPSLQSLYLLVGKWEYRVSYWIKLPWLAPGSFCLDSQHWNADVHPCAWLSHACWGAELCLHCILPTERPP